MKYEHIESEASLEIIEKAYHRAENSARHMFPMYIWITLSSIVSTAGLLYLFFSVKWWLLLTILLPFSLDVWFNQKFNEDIYEELEKYWREDRQYGILGYMLRSRLFVRENKLYQLSNFLIKSYRSRLLKRNQRYEKYYIRHLKQNFTKQNLIFVAKICNAVILFWLYSQESIDFGLLITLTSTIFTSLFSRGGLEGCLYIFRWSGYHVKTFDFYNKYFDLSEDEFGNVDEMPTDLTVEFDDVYFSYPGTDSPVLNGLSLKINHGEKVSFVGENGNGKTTIIKLLLGLYQPDSGEIRIGGRPLGDYSFSARRNLFAPVFQDFGKYSMTLAENIGIGDVSRIDDTGALTMAMNKAQVDSFANLLPNGINTLLNRDFDGGVDVSGGQWQRIAIARAFMGNNPILILDEPTSQIDPMEESRIYSEFAEIAENRTTIFITHRLASTKITNRIFVIANGRVVERGSHCKLILQKGIYYNMFEAQKKWYSQNEKGG